MLRYVLLPHAGEWRECQVVKRAFELNAQPVQIIETYHKGTAPQKFEGIRISADNVIATAFKKAEDGNGYILRCYETAGRAADATIEVPFLNRKWTASFGRCEIKTFKIPAVIENEIEENNLLELP